MRSSFDEFFKKFGQLYYDYDYEMFIEWVKVEHPRV